MNLSGKNQADGLFAERGNFLSIASLWIAPMALSVLLIIISYYNFLLFHTLAEFFAIIVAITTAVVAWHMYPFTRNNFLMYLGCGYFWVAMLDLVHNLVYKGINIFAITSSEPTISLWLSARFLESLLLLTAPIFLNRSLSRERSFYLFGVITIVFGLMVVFGAFPSTFIEGQGLTQFKVYSEYMIIGLLALALYHLCSKRDLLDARVLQIMSLSIVLTMCAEFAFTLYVSIDGLSNLVGHIFKLFSFWLIYIAVVRTTLQQPFRVMARGASTYEAVPDATIVVDGDGIIRQVNHTACKLAQIPENHLLGRHCHDVFHPKEFDTDQCPACSHLLAKRLAGPIELELRSIGKWFDYSFSPIGTAHGSQGMVETIRDITSRKHAEIMLRQSDSYNRALFENSIIGLALCRMDGELVDINQAYANIVGHSISETLKLSYWDITPEKYREQEQQQLVNLNTIGRYGPYEKEYIHSDGRLIPVRLRGQLLEKNGESYIFSSVEDITDRKVAEEKIHLSAVVFDNAGEAIIITDSNNDIISVNKSFIEITGYQEEEVLGKNPRLLKSGHHDAEFYNSMWRDINELGRWRGEVWDRRKDGGIFPSWQTISSVEDNEGRLSNYISVLSDISPLKETEEKLDFLAYHDPLTSLPNRLLLHDRLDHALQRSWRDKKKLAVLFIDLDRFKQVNDNLGHPVGDLLLKEAAERFTKVVRDEDTVSRLGGDEFVILMEDITLEQDVVLIVRKLMLEFEPPFRLKEHEFHITLSIGISIYPNDGEESEVLIKNADAAMYRAKEKGRNGYEYYTTALTKKALERLTMESALRYAIERNELILYYQPQVSLKIGKLLGVEALIRWQHPNYGLLPPERFISLAEESGLIVDIGEWVLRTACIQFKLWQAAGLEMQRIAVNISAIQIQRGKIEQLVKRVLEETQLKPSHLELELTESTLMENMNLVSGILEELRQLGVTVAIDDFGTGYSSLSYLKALPINKLKIDRSFIRDIPDDSNDVAITHAINALAQNMQLAVIAEGVETIEQVVYLESLGCNEAQGYLYSRPLPADEFLQWAKNF